MNEKTNILLLAHINPHPANADEILETLDNAQQCIPLHNRPKSEQTGIVKITSQQVKRMQKIEDDIQEIKSLYDKSKEMHAERLQALAKLIGINDQLALYADSIIGSKEYLTAKNFKDAAVKSTELEQRNKAILDKIKQINVDVEESKKSEKESSKQSLNYAEKLRLKIHELKDSIVDTKDASKEVHELNVIERAEELQKLLLHSHILIEEKASVVHNLPYALKSKASDIRNLTDIKEMAKDAVVHDFINNFKLKEELQLEEIEKNQSSEQRDFEEV